MKVIKEGRKQRGWSVEAACTGHGNGGGGCGATLLVEQPDLFRTSRSCRDETEDFVTFKCCACGVLTDLKGPGPPHDVVARLPGRSEWERAQHVVDGPSL